MFRFTIRDVLWLTVVVALAVGWVVDRRAAQENRRVALEVHSTDLKDMLHRDLVLDIVEDVISKPNPDLAQLREYLKTNRYQVMDFDASPTGDTMTPVPRRAPTSP